MDEIETLRTENTAIKREMVVEVIRRLSMERQALEATLSFIQVRGPQVDQELEVMKDRLVKLTKGDTSGPASN